ncbi:Tetratricopeptide repeat protein [Stieleria maiorica]|uniref:Tetratricopeptide repeat protein n=1 Tax=Stieleria maiorica TaxID=2795974 RepID=A0A5B9MET5_9BACT|nr:tetratricopeptide repeat protein [Stieleria maiorica]QEF99608.1 Tetratricopeptide repeat protein [Stieleria maiorica]
MGTSTTSPPTPDSISEFHEKKLKNRREEWQVNQRLAVISALTFAGILLLGAASYFYNSRAIAGTLRMQAEQAAADGDLKEELRWWSRYLMIVPDDTDVILRQAFAADDAAEKASSDDFPDALADARRQLSESLALLPKSLADEQLEIRKRLIRRLVQAGGYWFREAEHQIVDELDADPDDAFANKALAFALYGQHKSDLAGRKTPQSPRVDTYWHWLADQNPLLVLRRAAPLSSEGELDLIGCLLEMSRTNPEFIRENDSIAAIARRQPSRVQQWLQEIGDRDQVIRQSLVALRTLNTGRANLLLYSYGVRGDEADQKDAESLLMRSAPDAAARLQKLIADGDATPDSETSSDAVTAPVDERKLLRQVPSQYWDYELLMNAARLASSKAFGETTAESNAENGSGGQADQNRLGELASQWFETLMDSDLPEVTAGMRESTFHFAGLHALTMGDDGLALQIWRRGLKEIDGNNLDLNSVIVMQLAQSAGTDAELQAAHEAVDSFGRAIDAEKNRLLLSTTRELSQAKRNQMVREIDMAMWRYNVASAELSTRGARGTKEISAAIDQLEQALKSDAAVTPREKALVASNLAAFYTRMEMWDQAAHVLSIALELMPNDLELRARAGQAWAKAGNHQRAAENWRFVSGSNQLDVRVRAAKAEFDVQLQTPPDARDFSRLRTMTSRLQQDLDKVLAEKNSSTENADDEIAELESTVRLLALSVPPEGGSLEKHLASRTHALNVDRLADELPDSAQVQGYAAERLAAIDLVDRAEQRLVEMEAILGIDALPVLMVRARIDAARGKPAEAAKRLLGKAGSSPQEQVRIAHAASALFLMANDMKNSYEALQRVPEDHRLPVDFYRLYRLADQLASSAPEASEAASYRKQAEQWTDKLRLMKSTGDEGSRSADPGSYWRMIVVEQEMSELRDVDGTISRNDPKVRELTELLDEILVQRPHWGRALSMQGQLLAVLGRSEEAVEQLRTGIAAGDRTYETRQLLLEQLVKLGRGDEVYGELKKLANPLPAVASLYSTSDIREDLGRGDLLAAVDRARKSIEDHPNDMFPLAVFAQVSSAAVDLHRQARSLGNESEMLSKEQEIALIDEAREALKKAESLSQENEFVIAEAALQLEFRHGTPEAIDATWARIEQSSLPSHQRAVLHARYLLSKGDLDGAIEKLDLSNQMMPSISKLLQLAQLYQTQNRSSELIETLRRAVRLAPDREDVRTELAKALVIHAAADTDWDEVESLLQDGSRSIANSRFLYAVLLSARGGEEELQQALAISRELSADEQVSNHGADALQFSVLHKLIEQLDSSDTTEESTLRDRYLDEMRQVARHLSEAENASSVDLHRYAAFLLQYGNDDDLESVKSIAIRLRAVPDGIVASLDLLIRYSQRSGNFDDVSRVVQDWATKVKSEQSGLRPGEVESTAGRVLMRFELNEEALDWYKNAYELNPDAVGSYVIALGASQQHHKAAEIAAAHYEKHGDVTSARLLVETLLAANSIRSITKHSALVISSIKRHDRDAPLLEGVATLLTQQGKPEEAVKLYHRVLALDPLRVRSLNNIAMAYAEIPGMAVEGITPIDRALKLTRRNPELLDTKGFVLMKAGRVNEALEVFDEAIQSVGGSEPRYQFHKILAFKALGRDKDAQQLWKQLDVKALDLNGLTKEEQKQLQEMVDNSQTLQVN